MRDKYIKVNNKYLAYALSFAGFKYLAFDKENGSKIYSFVNTYELRRAMSILADLRKENNKF